MAAAQLDTLRIGVVSDTHETSLDDLPKRLVDELSGMEMIVHVGDFDRRRLVEELMELGNFRGVWGNSDPYPVSDILPPIDTVEVNGFKIGLNHPSEGGPPEGLEERIREKFKEVDVIIYGHTHKAKIEKRGGVLYFNPGSGTGIASPATYGILTVDSGIRAEIVHLI